MKRVILLVVSLIAVQFAAAQIYLGSGTPTLGTGNYINTWSGPLKLNSNIGTGIQNTIINAFHGRVGLATVNPRARVQILQTLTFHERWNGRFMSWNSYWGTGGGSQVVFDRRIQTGHAGAVWYYPWGAIGMQIADRNVAGTSIVWKSALYARHNGKMGFWNNNPKERIHIGRELTIHDGGTKYIARNVYTDKVGNAYVNKRLVDGNSASIRITSSGRIELATNAGSGLKDTTIPWTLGFRVHPGGRVGIGVDPSWTILPKGQLEVRYAGPDPEGKAIVSSVNGATHKAILVLNRSLVSAACPKGEVFRVRGNGLVEAKEICILADGWCDDVFLPDYELRSLEEVAGYIDEFGHLPEVPSEATVMEEGHRLGEMDKALLRKVEELTLYAIEREEEVDSLQAELAAVRSELAVMAEVMARLEALEQRVGEGEKK